MGEEKEEELSQQKRRMRNKEKIKPFARIKRTARAKKRAIDTKFKRDKDRNSTGITIVKQKEENWSWKIQNNKDLLKNREEVTLKNVGRKVAASVISRAVKMKQRLRWAACIYALLLLKECTVL